MDKIIVRTNDEMQKVIYWAESLNNDPIKMPFQKAEIEFQEEGILLRFQQVDDSIIFFECETKGHKVAEWTSNLNNNEITNLRVNATGERKAALCLLLANDNTVAKCIKKFKSLMLFATYYKEEVERTKVIERKCINQKKTKSRKAGKRTLTTRKYIITDEILSELPPEKRTYKKHAKNFSVRGHYRTLQTGKTVWIRPYIKGKNSTQADSVYILR